jgi:hypothetical protein
MSELPSDEPFIPAGAEPGRRKAAVYEAHGAQSFAATSAPPRAHSLPPVHSFVWRSPLTEAFIELDSGGNLQGDRIRREIVTRHAAIGIKAKRYPLSGGSRFRGSGHDADIYAFGTDEGPLVAEGKSRLLRRDWIAQARALRIEDEIARREIKLNGRGPEATDHARSAAAPTDSRSTPVSRFDVDLRERRGRRS